MMGRQQIESLKGRVSEDERLKLHLHCNHDPPVHLDFVPDCKEAIKAVNEGDYNKEITLCNGIIKKAYEIGDGLHLESFLDEA